jgi:hypothetical protein
VWSPVTGMGTPQSDALSVDRMEKPFAKAPF